MGITILISLVVLFCSIIVLAWTINSKNYAIPSEEGIEFYGFIQVGGIDQYVQIRGKDKENPVIIFLHGGPGFPITYLSTYHQQYLEDGFTFVNYDQRGSGRTYYRNLDKNLNDQLSPKVLQEDLAEIVDYVCQELDQEKVIIMGQSWGTVLGTNYVKSAPEKVEAYIGVGQVVDFDQGKVASAESAILLANEEDKSILQDNIKIFEGSTAIKDVDVPNLESLILTSGKYLTSGEEVSGIKQMWLGLTSPTMNFNDLKWFLKAASTEKIFELEEELIDYMYFDFDIYDQGLTYEVPMYFIQGSNDYITPTEMVEKFYEPLKAPEKKMVLQENGGHTPFLDDPKAFADLLKSFFY